MRTSFRIVLVVSLGVSGCNAPDPAPGDLDGLARWFWLNEAGADDEGLAEGLANLEIAADVAGYEEHSTGSLTGLQPGDAAHVDLPDAALSEAAGFYLVNRFPCTMEALQPILYALDQDRLYPGAYDRYERSYTSDLAAYQAEEPERLTWEIELESSYIGASFTEWLNGGLRRVPNGAPNGDIVVAHTYMPRPAEFEEGSNKRFEQDYQIEVYWESAPGEVFHVYGLWRELDFGGGLDTNSDVVVNIVLGNLKDWDDQTARLCAGEEPEP